MSKIEPIILRDFRQGRYIPYSVATSLVPQNSVAHSKNVNFDVIVGSAVVRPGTTPFGPAFPVAGTPLGLGEFTTSGFFPNTNQRLAPVSAINILVGIYPNGTVTGGGTIMYSPYYLDTFGTLLQGKDLIANQPFEFGNGVGKTRFAVLGGRIFLTNLGGMWSSANGVTWGHSLTESCIADSDVKPDLIYRYIGRLVCSGGQAFPSRVYFSSVISPGTTPFVTWNADYLTGDFIDVNPDDGGHLTGFGETSTFLLVFKNNGFYRMDTVTKTTDPENIYNIGAVSQEGIVSCQGVVYFFSGYDIRQTNGGFPDQISRAGVQDIIDAIPQANWADVAGGTDGLNVYFSVGDVTLNKNKDNEQTILNCVIKYSPRDQNWSVHSYHDRFRVFCQFTNTLGRLMYGADMGGRIQSINTGTTDNGNAINYELESQDLEGGNRSHLKQISDKLIVYTNNGIDSTIQFRQDGGNIKDVPMKTNQRVNIGRDINLKGNFFNFRWLGESMGTAPVLEGFEIQDITDLGTNTNNG